MTAKNTGQSDDKNIPFYVYAVTKVKKNQQVAKNTRFGQQMILLLKTAFLAGINHEKKISQLGKNYFPVG